MNTGDIAQPLTQWLHEWQQQPTGTRLDTRLLEAVYAQLRRLASQRLAREAHAVLTPTELVHETWLRLKPANAPIADRNAFLRLVSVAMRHLLIDQARERLSRKGGGAMQPISVSLTNAGQAGGTLDDTRLLDLDRALAALAADHPRAAEAVSLRAFGGLELDELAAALNVSLTTAKRDLAFGRAWLAAALKEPCA